MEYFLEQLESRKGLEFPQPLAGSMGSLRVPWEVDRGSAQPGLLQNASFHGHWEAGVYGEKSVLVAF